MNEIETRKVVQSNDLITGVAKMDAVPLKIFELAVSLINPMNPPKNNTVILSKSEMFSFFDVTSENKYTRFRESIKKLQENSVFQVTYEDTHKGFRYQSIVPIPFVEWTDYEDEVKVRFDQEIIPYLINLKENFTQYAITDIGKLNSKHSIVLYKWLTMNFNLFKKYGNPTNQNPAITIKELRKLTDTELEYKRFYDFEKRVLKESIEEINKQTHYQIEYEKTRKGKKINGVQFYIEENKQKKQEEYLQYKDINVTERAEQLARERRADMVEDYPLALNNRFILYLIEQELVQFNDMEKVVGLYRNVAPLYLEMINYKQNFMDPNITFHNHIAYVKEHIVDTELKYTNLVEYLRVAAEDYLSKLERINGKK